MEFRQWLSRSYKAPDGTHLTIETVDQYEKMLEEVKTYLLKVENTKLGELSAGAMRKIHDRLSTDKVFAELTNSEAMAHVLDLYVQYKERN